MTDGMADLEGSRTIEIAAPRQRCFDIAADLDHVPEWHGSMRSVEVVERDGDGRATLVDSDLDASVTQVRMRLRFSYDPPGAIRWTRESGDLRSLDGSWRFDERDDGLTVATYRLEIGVNRRLGMLARTVRGPVRGRVESLLVDRPVQGLKERAEASG